jgi:hypothetical protein
MVQIRCLSQVDRHKTRGQRHTGYGLLVHGVSGSGPQVLVKLEGDQE